MSWLFIHLAKSIDGVGEGTRTWDIDGYDGHSKTRHPISTMQRKKQWNRPYENGGYRYNCYKHKLIKYKKIKKRLNRAKWFFFEIIGKITGQSKIWLNKAQITNIMNKMQALTRNVIKELLLKIIKILGMISSQYINYISDTLDIWTNERKKIKKTLKT